MKTFFSLLTIAAFGLLANVATAQEMPYDRAGDNYPKNDGIDIINYAFEIQFTDNSDFMSGTTTIDARYLTAGQHELRLDLTNKSDELDGKGMTVEWVKEGDTALAYRHEGNELFIDMGRELLVQERISVTVRYSGVPAAGLRAGPNKYGNYSFFSDNWSSKARNWLPTVDHPYEKAMNELIVTAPAHLQVISNGVLIEESVTENGDRLTHWKNSVPIATWLYVVGVSPFAVQYVDTFDGKSIQTWVYRQDRDAGFYDFAVPSKQVLTFYSDLIGPYSYEKLANFVSAATGGGMEAASAVAYGERSVTGERSTRWQNVIIHEIAHQWFGNSVTEHEWNHVWLSEGFATYYTLLYREYANGRDDFVDGLINSRDRVFAYYEDDYDFQLIRDELGDLDDISGAMMYQRGAWTLHMLREMIGVDAYNAGVRNYYSEYQNKTALTGDFRRHMEEISGLDLSGFFGQWLYQGGVPVLEGSWSVDDGQLTIVMAQIQEKYEFDLTVDFGISYKDGSYERISIGIAPGQPSVRSTPVEKEVLNIVVDPDTRVLARWTFERK